MQRLFNSLMKITTVIPAYKPKYLLELLASLVHQSEPPEQVIFSDDSADLAFAQVLLAEPVRSLIAHLNVSVVQGPRRGAHANWAHCINAWGGRTELVHILCDDDIVYPHFYECHRRAHMSGVFSSTVSRRWYANEQGKPLRHELGVPEIVAHHPHRLLAFNADSLFAHTVAIGSNWLGEVSNVVMRAETAELIRTRQFESIGFAGLEDLGAFVCGAMAHPLCFINEHLGFFRQSPDQNSAQTMGKPLKLGHLAYIALAIIGRNCGRLNAAQVLSCIRLIGPVFLRHYGAEDDVKEFCEILPALMREQPGAEGRFLALWTKFAQ